MKLTLKNTLFGLLAIIVFVVLSLYLGYTYTVLGNITDSDPAGGNALSGEFTTYTFFATSTANTTWLATTTSATSSNITRWTDSSGRIDNGYFVIAGAKKIEFYFTRGDTTGAGNTGKTRFQVQFSPDGSTWYYVPKMVLATSTSNTSYVSDVWISAASSTVAASVDLGVDTFYAVRCITTEYTDGEHSCKATAEF